MTRFSNPASDAESIGHTIRMLGAHDLVHRRQIDRILASV